MCLLKHVQYLQDTTGAEITLQYIRTRDGREIDFAIARNGKIDQLIEVKLSDDSLSACLRFFLTMFPGVPAFQLVHNLRREQSIAGAEIVHASKWLSNLIV